MRLWAAGGHRRPKSGGGGDMPGVRWPHADPRRLDGRVREAVGGDGGPARGVRPRAVKRRRQGPAPGRRLVQAPAAASGLGVSRGRRPSGVAQQSEPGKRCSRPATDRGGITMPSQKLNRSWVSWYWGAVFLTLLPTALFMMTFVSPKGPHWWVWFVDAAPDWLMWIVRALLVVWVAAAWKFQTRPLLQDLRRRREQASSVALGASAETRVLPSGPAPPFPPRF